jgi:hypothetical protein
VCVHGTILPVPGEHPGGHRMSHVQYGRVHSWEIERVVRREIGFYSLTTGQETKEKTNMLQILFIHNKIQKRS